MALLALAFVVAAVQQGPDPSRDYLLTEKDAVLLGPAEVASNSVAQSIKWSGDGKFLAIQRMSMDNSPQAFNKMLAGENPGSAFKPQTELLLWSASGKSTRKLMSISALQTNLRSFEWMGLSQTLIAHFNLSEAADEVWMLPATGSPRKVLATNGEEMVQTFTSPSVPLTAIAITTVSNQTVVKFMDATGRMSNEFAIPPQSGIFGWSADGTKFIVGSAAPTSGANKSRGWYAMDRMSGQLLKVADSEVREPRLLRHQDIAVQGGNIELPMKPGMSIKAPITVLTNSKEEKEPSYAIVSSDGTLSSIAPDGSAVAYVTQGVALVRPLIRVPKEAFVKAREAAERTVILSRAKQVGLGLIMLASDNDDTYPGPDGWQDKVYPYLKNRDTMSGFNYTYAGGRMIDIAEPAKTVLGFLSGPGGKAVVYADGHVKWENN